jgi:hypothetical protein
MKNYTSPCHVVGEFDTKYVHVTIIAHGDDTEANSTKMKKENHYCA